MRHEALLEIHIGRGSLPQASLREMAFRQLDQDEARLNYIAEVFGWAASTCGSSPVNSMQVIISSKAFPIVNLK